jgi:hypothetical protein
MQLQRRACCESGLVREKDGVSMVPTQRCAQHTRRRRSIARVSVCQIDIVSGSSRQSRQTWYRRRDVLSLLQTRAADDVISSKTRLVAPVHVSSKDTSADNASAVRDGEVNLPFGRGRM